MKTEIRQILKNQINIMLHLDSFSDKKEFVDCISSSTEFFMDKEKEDCCDMKEKGALEEKSE